MRMQDSKRAVVPIGNLLLVSGCLAGLSALGGCSPRVAVPPSQLPEISAAISRSPSEGIRVATAHGHEKLAGGLSSVELEQDSAETGLRSLTLPGPVWASRVGDDLVLTYESDSRELPGVSVYGGSYKQTHFPLASVRSTKVTAYGSPLSRGVLGGILLAIGTPSLALGGYFLGGSIDAGGRRDGELVVGPFLVLSIPALVVGLGTAIPGIYLIATSGAPERPSGLPYDTARATPRHVQGLDAPVVSRAGFVF
jgi:hypothetical protein